MIDLYCQRWHFIQHGLPALILLLITTLTSSAARGADGLNVVDYALSRVSSDPFYQQNSLDDRIVLALREVVLAGRERTAGADNNVLLLIHGATFPGTVSFDLDFANVSMMRHFAERGWDTFTFDFQGYGASTRPPLMDSPKAFTDAAAPLRSAVNVEDIDHVVEFISDLRNVKKIHLLGWSFGATLEAPMYAIRYPDKIEKLILYAGEYRWEASDEKRAQRAAELNQEKVRSRTVSSIDNDWAWLGTQTEFVLPGAFAAYRKAHLASDPRSGELGGAVRWPLGRFVDSWLTNPHFDAAKITVPTLVVRGSEDTFATRNDNQALFAALGSAEKYYEEIPGAGHFIQYEKTNALFYAKLLDFLDGKLDDKDAAQ